ncbi:MAG TPA: YdcF family protein [Gemmatimonadaceae bacterium]|nr:YdcF family protein [Gemmatimonadaceae bacterium]
MVAGLRNERLGHVVLGAACGFLVAMALVAASLPILPGSNAKATCVVAMLLGALIASTIPVRWIAVLAALVAVMLFMITFTPLTGARVHAWIRRDPPPARAPDAVVVLATTISVDGLLDATGTTRLLSALELMRQTGAPMLVTTRPSHVAAASLGAAMQDYRRLIGLVGDTSRWRVVGPVATTHDEAVAVSAFLAPAATRSIIVVTSPLHTRRACATFEAVGFSVTCRPSDERRYALQTFSGIRTRLAATVDWMYESAAAIEYRWRGWMR